MTVETLEDRRLLAVVINEIHYNPAENTSREEFIELYNAGPLAVDVSGWEFADGIQFVFPQGESIPAGGYLLVAEDPATLHAEFGVAALGPLSGGLSGDGERIALRTAQGALVDEVDYGVSFPWPVAADGNGASMELIHPALDNDLGSSWRPSYVTPLSPTPSVPPPPPVGGSHNHIAHRWSFNGNLHDSVGGAHGLLVDPAGVASFTSAQLNFSGNSGQNSNQSPFTSGAYVDLPNGIISNLGGDATFEWWGTVTHNRTWAEIWSFGTSTGGEGEASGASGEEYVTLIPQSGSGTLRITHRDGGRQLESFTDWNQPLPTEQEFHVTVVWDSVSDVQRMYVNGTLIGSSPLLIDLADIEDVNNWLGRSQWPDPLFDGWHNEFRIYDRALTAAQVAASFAAGPDAVPAAPAINAFAASSLEIVAGQSVTLSWDVTDADSLAINQGVGDVTGLQQVVVTPTTTTTYTLSAVSGQETATRSLRVTVDVPRATPGARNNVYSENAAPAIRQVRHADDPTSADPVVVTAKVTDPQGVASVLLQYQVVLPGQYVPARLPVPLNQLVADGDLLPTANPAYFNPASWTTVAMLDQGTGGDQTPGDGVYAVTLPAVGHRTLVRYRIAVTDALGAAATVPYDDDPSLNFAYFVYDGLPLYRNSVNQAVADAEALASLPVYHLLTRSQDINQAYAYHGVDEIPQGTDARFAYNWSGTMVYNGQVYDNITYRLRGANGRYLTDGKRSMRFRFNDGAWFEPLDLNGDPYPTKWKTLTTGKGFDNRQTLTYSLNEATTMLLSNLMGLPAPDTHWFQFRVIDAAAEAPDPWRGDFWGIQFALEDYDRRFLDAHGLEAGNLYKLVNQTQDALRQLDYQAPYAVSDGSDHDYIEDQLTRASGDIEHRVNLEKYFVFHALAEAVRHYDYWPTANKNMAYYFEPEYAPENDFLGKLWILMWDTDATWGPTWNDGRDVVYEALFTNNNVAYRNALIRPAYYNVLRELRDLIWQPDQLRGIVEELVAHLLPLEQADRTRWQGAPADAGNYNGLSGPGTVSLANYVQDMLNFAFVGGNWPGGSVGTGGRAAFLDDILLRFSGEQQFVPLKPTISYVGDLSFAANQLAFQTTPFADPQGAQTFAAVEWRVAQVTDVGAGLDPTRTFLPEWNANWESGSLTVYNDTIAPPSTAVVPGATHRARVRFQDDTGRWSNWSEPFVFTPTAADDVQAVKDHLRIAEIHYNPLPAMPQFGDDNVDAEEFEFLELVNASPHVALDLSGVQLADGVTFTFPAGTALAPGERIAVVEDVGNFRSRYGAAPRVAGEWTGALHNAGELLTVLASDGAVVQQVAYSDAWWKRTDGGGSALEVIDPYGDPLDPTNWRPSVAFHGTPGAAPLELRDVVVNEVLANPLAPALDVIELWNTSSAAVDLSGWYLSDSSANPLKYAIPPGTLLGAGAWVVFDETHFSPGGGLDPGDFALSSLGELVSLVAVDPQGKPLRFADVAAFDGSSPGVSLGRIPDGAGDYGLFPLAIQSLGAANGRHRAADVVLSEVHYRPSAVEGEGAETSSTWEFLELANAGASVVDLSGWRVDGAVQFTLPAGALVWPGEALLVVGFDASDAVQAAAFRAHYGLATSVPLWGPYVGALGDVQGEVKLMAPMAAGAAFELTDRVTYAAAAPWPSEAAGDGNSLARTLPQAFGDFATSWRAAAPTPGQSSFRLEGDFDDNGPVDGFDFLAWQRSFGATPLAGAFTHADGNGDGSVNDIDLAAWEQQFGAVPGAFFASAVAAAYVAPALTPVVAGGLNWADPTDAAWLAARWAEGPAAHRGGRRRDAGPPIAPIATEEPERGRPPRGAGTAEPAAASVAETRRGRPREAYAGGEFSGRTVIREGAQETAPLTVRDEAFKRW